MQKTSSRESFMQKISAFFNRLKSAFFRTLNVMELGDDDRIWGYNPVYRTNAVAQRFESFELVHNRPSAFNYQGVTIVPQTNPPTLINDHQGHIVPQNLLIRAMANVAAGLAACNDMVQVNAFIAANNAAYPWLQQVLNFGNNVNPPIDLFDFGEDGETRVRSFFSVIIWNPVNICRAPADSTRGNYPGNTIDALVSAYLQANPAGVDAAWLAALALLPAAPTDAQLNTYIGACCSTLANQVNHGTGYYQFNWRFDPANNNNLVPQ